MHDERKIDKWVRYREERRGEKKREEEKKKRKEIQKLAFRENMYVYTLPILYSPVELSGASWRALNRVSRACVQVSSRFMELAGWLAGWLAGGMPYCVCLYMYMCMDIQLVISTVERPLLTCTCISDYVQNTPVIFRVIQQTKPTRSPRVDPLLPFFFSFFSFS